MSQEKFPGPDMTGGGVEKQKDMASFLTSTAGQSWRDRSNKEIGDAVTHAETWLKGTAHLHDEDLVAKGTRLIQQGRRGLMMMDEVNSGMKRLFGYSYPDFDPSDVQINIPPHLGEQFK